MQALAEAFAISASTLQRRLAAEHTTASDVVRDVRLETALALLHGTSLHVGEIAARCGYESHSRFSAAFRSGLSGGAVGGGVPGMDPGTSAVVRRDLVAVPVVALAGAVLARVAVVAGLLGHVLTEDLGQPATPLPVRLRTLGRRRRSRWGAHAQTPGTGSGSVVAGASGVAVSLGEAVSVGVAVSDGDYYAREIMVRLGLFESGGAVRIGFCHYHSPDEVDRVLDALRELG